MRCACRRPRLRQRPPSVRDPPNKNRLGCETTESHNLFTGTLAEPSTARQSRPPMAAAGAARRGRGSPAAVRRRARLRGILSTEAIQCWQERAEREQVERLPDTGSVPSPGGAPPRDGRRSGGWLNLRRPYLASISRRRLHLYDDKAQAPALLAIFAHAGLHEEGAIGLARPGNNRPKSGVASRLMTCPPATFSTNERPCTVRVQILPNRQIILAEVHRIQELAS